MKIAGIAGSVVGSKTRIAVEQILNKMKNDYQEVDTTLIDLSDYELVFSDGRDYRDYSGDTKWVLEEIMAADAYIIGTPIFQASIPGALKNLFDLLPNEAFREKVVGIVATAGSAKHYLVPEHQLKPILSYMKAVIIPKYVFVEEKNYYQKKIVDDDAIFRLHQLADDLVHGINVFSEIQQEKDSAFPF
ncbi:NADPH-dependent FMN reductase [Lentibacillus salicampi]|uniref:NAD(P)H-dependent oxidoreductase n=1 Tax=Lentibacillus salicampi TaxID=175306 RepID=A0A4Y9A9W3_9BACI|nr:NADPH-dependent FMN reductase [Lentibacillus salicampi]TFJ92669.1 NAD(P)H-dependent oxidoreductase [Lentibacillus salicampi]